MVAVTMTVAVVILILAYCFDDRRRCGQHFQGVPARRNGRLRPLSNARKPEDVSPCSASLPTPEPRTARLPWWRRWRRCRRWLLLGWSRTRPIAHSQRARRRTRRRGLFVP